MALSVADDTRRLKNRGPSFGKKIRACQRTVQEVAPAKPLTKLSKTAKLASYPKFVGPMPPLLRGLDSPCVGCYDFKKGSK